MARVSEIGVEELWRQGKEAREERGGLNHLREKTSKGKKKGGREKEIGWG